MRKRTKKGKDREAHGTVTCKGEMGIRGFA